MKHILPLLGLFWALHAGAQSPEALPLSSPSTDPVCSGNACDQAQRFTLSNGMTLIVKPDRRAPTAIHMLWVKVGSIDEVDGTSGVAHVLEHMMFKGTPSLAPGEFSRRVAALGGRENAFTGRDYTGYFQQIPANRLGDVMALEADRFLNNQWADDEFRREIEVVKEERRLRTEDSPQALLYETLNATAFTASPYRRPIIGWMNDLDALTPEEVRAFHKRWYMPGNAAVVVVGDVDVAQVRTLAEQHYGASVVRALPQRKPRLEPAQQGLRTLRVKAPAEQAYLSLAFKVPGLAPGDLALPLEQPLSEAATDALALTVLSAVLDGHSGARLQRSLTQGDNRLADRAGASNGLMGRGPQLFVIDAVPAPGKAVPEVQAALREQVARVARDGVSEAELNRVKTQWVASEVYKLDSGMNQARELGSYWVLGQPLDASERLITRLRAISAEQVKAVAERYFGDDQLTVAELVPQPLDKNAKPRAAPAGRRH